MSDPIRNALLRWGAHLSGDFLTRLISQELSASQASRACRHLSGCPECRARHEQLERLARAITECRMAVAAPSLSRRAEQRRQFVGRLDELLQDSRYRPRWSRWGLVPRLLAHGTGHALPSSIGFGLLAAMTLFLIWQRNLPTVTASEFLQRAATSNAGAPKSARVGVAFQRVLIRTTRGVLERSIYRDIEGRRRPKHSKFRGEEQQAEAELVTAGFLLEDPLSAVAFKDWHDRQAASMDTVGQTGEGLLTLTATVPDGIVAQESLTVRGTDFHPVKRTAEFRDSRSVQVVELDYEVLSWRAVNEAMFEPLPEAPATASIPVRASPASAVLPLAKAVLDEAELQALLILNHLASDSGEQIEVARDAQGIQIRGLVETDERKRELQRELNGLPHLTTSIFSFQDVRSRTPSGTDNGVVQMTSVMAQPSPLERYFTARGRNRDDLSRISHGLFDSSLTVDRESRSITALIQRFAASQSLSPVATAALNELMASHRARLLTALEQEDRLLVATEIVTAVPDGAPDVSTPASAADLASAAERNLALCKELISGSDAPPRPAQVVASELSETVTQLRRAALQVRTDFNDSESSGTKQ